MNFSGKTETILRCLAKRYLLAKGKELVKL